MTTADTQILRERRGLALGRAIGLTDALLAELERASGRASDGQDVLRLYRQIGAALGQWEEAAKRVTDAEESR